MSWVILPQRVAKYPREQCDAMTNNTDNGRDVSLTSGTNGRVKGGM